MLSLFLESENIDIMCITESWLTEKKLHLINIDGYKKIAVYCRTNRTGGGILILARNNLNVKARTDVGKLSIEQDCEIGAIELSNVIILVVYRSPTADINIFKSKLEECLEKLTNNNNKYIILCGDFNVHFSIVDDRNVLSDVLDCFLLKQQIFEYTRITPRSKSCLDNFFNGLGCN